MTGGGPDAGWYADPDSPGSGATRYWDGVAWTEHRQAAPPPAVPTVDETMPLAVAPSEVLPPQPMSQAPWSTPTPTSGQQFPVTSTAPQFAPGQPYVSNFAQAPAAQLAVTNVTKSPGMAIASVVLGVGAFFIALLPCVGLLTVPFAIVGLVLGIAGLARALRGFEGRGLSIVGIISSLLSLLVTAVIFFAFSASLSEVANDFGPAPEGSFLLREISCGQDSLGYGEYEASITNRDSEPHAFSVSVVFQDGTRRLGSPDSGYSGSLQPGQEGTIRISSLAQVPTGATCSIESVEFAGQ